MKNWELREIITELMTNYTEEQINITQTKLNNFTTKYAKDFTTNKSNALDLTILDVISSFYIYLRCSLSKEVNKGELTKMFYQIYLDINETVNHY